MKKFHMLPPLRPDEMHRIMDIEKSRPEEPRPEPTTRWRERTYQPWTFGQQLSDIKPGRVRPHWDRSTYDEPNYNTEGH